MRRPRLEHLLLLAVLFVAFRAWAGNIENFMPCSKSNDCKSKACTENRCRPSESWNGEGKLGTECNNDGNCKSRRCERRVCVAPTPKPTPRVTSPTTKHIPDEEPKFLDEPEVVLDDCSRPLAEGIFEGVPDVAVELCAMYDGDTIARALKLFEGNYGVGVSDTCRAIKGRTDAEVECGKKAWNALSADDRKVFPFKIPLSCTPAKRNEAELQRCTEDLLKKAGTALREGRKEADAAYACATYDSGTLANAKKAVSMNFGGDFLLLCRTVDGRSNEELACAVKTFDKDLGTTVAERINYEFRMPLECEAGKKK
jgi:hypothetical protein